MAHKALIKHMESEFPNEGCGFILNTGKWIPVTNTVEEHTTDATKERSFFIDPLTYLEYSGNIKYVVHSHISANPDSDSPSNTDFIHQKVSGVKWMVVVLDTDGKYARDYEFGEAVV